MPQAFRKYIIRISVLTGIMAAIGLIAQSVLPPQRFPIAFLPLLAFFYLLSAGAHFILVKANENSPKRFIAYFMGVSGMKLLAYIAALAIYVLLIDRAGAIPFVIAFAILYLIYMVFDITALMGEVRKSK